MSIDKSYINLNLYFKFPIAYFSERKCNAKFKLKKMFLISTKTYHHHDHDQHHYILFVI